MRKRFDFIIKGRKKNVKKSNKFVCYGSNAYHNGTNICFGS